MSTDAMTQRHGSGLKQIEINTSPLSVFGDY